MLPFAWLAGALADPAVPRRRAEEEASCPAPESPDRRAEASPGCRAEELPRRRLEAVAAPESPERSWEPFTPKATLPLDAVGPVLAVRRPLSPTKTIAPLVAITSPELAASATAGAIGSADCAAGSVVPPVVVGSVADATASFGCSPIGLTAIHHARIAEPMKARVAGDSRRTRVGSRPPEVGRTIARHISSQTPSRTTGTATLRQ